MPPASSPVARRAGRTVGRSARAKRRGGRETTTGLTFGRFASNTRRSRAASGRSVRTAPACPSSSGGRLHDQIRLGIADIVLILGPATRSFAVYRCTRARIKSRPPSCRIRSRVRGRIVQLGGELSNRPSHLPPWIPIVSGRLSAQSESAFHIYINLLETRQLVRYLAKIIDCTSRCETKHDHFPANAGCARPAGCRSTATR